MRPHSLRLRLLLLSALSIVVTLTIAGFALSSLFAEHVQRNVEQDLTAEFNRLAALVDADSRPLRLTQPMSDPRFNVAYGGIYWQVRDPASGDIARSQSTWTSQLVLDRQANPGAARTVVTLSNPRGQPATGVAQRLSFDLDGGAQRTLDLVVAEDNTISETAIAAYRADLVRDLAVLAVILMLSAWGQVTLGLAPLSVIRRGVNAIRRGQTDSLAGEFPSEVTPLVEEVNELTRTHEVSVDFARARAADLAHGLKSSLQVLNAHAHNLRTAGQEKAADDIEALTADMVSTIDHQLGMSRLRRRSARASSATPIAEPVEKVLRTLSATRQGAALEWQVDVAGDVTLALDRQDLMELLGVVLENAAQWCGNTIRVSARSSGERTCLSVEDDGPGLSPQQMARLGQRGTRIDETRSGSGIGLSIAREIVALNDGTLEFARSELGGLKVTVTLPSGVALEAQ